ILDAASQVFAKKGVHESRMDDIVKKSGLSKGTLYWYFKSKDDILIGIFEQMFHREFEELEHLQHLEGTASDRLLYFTEQVIRDINKMLRFMPIAYEFISLAFRRKFVQESFKQYINTFIDILVPIIQQGIDSGEFHPVDPLEVAIASSAIFEGTILLWVYDKTLVNPDQHIRAGINLILAGIKT
ncbi:MAG: TetR/AcrR family transcriptional regulator, partial [Anaerolineales bacterium]|nr:TetR/AcrR family transcriptional regulator [Anaerolineales bacterium]